MKVSFTAWQQIWAVHTTNCSLRQGHAGLVKSLSADASLPEPQLTLQALQRQQLGRRCAVVLIPEPPAGQCGLWNPMQLRHRLPPSWSVLQHRGILLCMQCEPA